MNDGSEEMAHATGVGDEVNRHQIWPGSRSEDVPAGSLHAVMKAT